MGVWVWVVFGSWRCAAGVAVVCTCVVNVTVPCDVFLPLLLFPQQFLSQYAAPLAEQVHLQLLFFLIKKQAFFLSQRGRAKDEMSRE